MQSTCVFYMVDICLSRDSMIDRNLESSEQSNVMSAILEEKICFRRWEGNKKSTCQAKIVNK